MYIGKFKNYPIFVSDKYPKKYYATVNDKKVHFGDIRYQHYYDKMGYYELLNHCDLKRRRSFQKRHGKSKDAKGTAGWFSYHILW